MKRMSVAGRWLIAALMVLSPMVPAHTLTFAFAADEPPVSYSKDGSVTGSLPEVTRLVFRFLPEYQLDLLTVPWPRAQRMVESGSVDGFITYPSEKRRDYAVFTERPAYFIDYGFLVYHRDNPKRTQLEAARSFDDLRELTFIGQHGAQWERENIPAFLDTIEANSLDAMIHLLMRRQSGDFIIMPPEQAIYLARQFGYRTELAFRSVEFIPNSKIPFHIGISKAVDRADTIIDAADAVLRSNEFLTEREQLIKAFRQ